MRWAASLLLALVLFGHAAVVLAQQQPEVSLTDEEFKKLDTFEGVELGKADKACAAGEYRRAAAQYDSFLLQFPKSQATPYALLRKARCLELDNKRFDAIKGYTEVLDYFPNAIRYAGAALYYIGECHFLNGDLKEAMKAWTEMAKDADYRKHYLASGAINQLADNLVLQNKPAEAMEYYKQVAVDFRRANPVAARYAIDKVLTYYIRTQPDEPKLHDFYNKAETFEGDPYPPNDQNYWQRVRENIRRLGAFAPTEKTQHDAYYQYWAGAMEGKNPTWDDFQIDWAEFHLMHEGDTTRWMERLDKQFNQYQKPGDFARIVVWIRVYHDYKSKMQEYYAKVDFTKMGNDQIQVLMQSLFDEVHNPELAKSTYAKFKWDAMNDTQKYYLERFLWHADEQLTVETCGRFADADSGKMELMRYYHWRQLCDKGIALADEMAKVPQYAQEAYYNKGDMRYWQNKFPEAIAAYQAADNPPTNLYQIAQCYINMGKIPQAVAQYKEIEGFFKDNAPDAALRIAHLYQATGDKKQYIAALRGVMKKYPSSPQSSAAHIESKAIGVAIGGGIDAQ